MRTDQSGTRDRDLSLYKSAGFGPRSPLSFFGEGCASWRSTSEWSVWPEPGQGEAEQAEQTGLERSRAISLEYLFGVGPHPRAASPE